MKQIYEFLEDLKSSGNINMFGAVPYLEAEFGMTKSKAKEVLAAWMKSFN